MDDCQEHKLNALPYSGDTYMSALGTQIELQDSEAMIMNLTDLEISLEVFETRKVGWPLDKNAADSSLCQISY